MRVPDFWYLSQYFILKPKKQTSRSRIFTDFLQQTFFKGLLNAKRMIIWMCVRSSKEAETASEDKKLLQRPTLKLKNNGGHLSAPKVSNASFLRYQIRKFQKWNYCKYGYKIKSRNLVIIQVLAKYLFLAHFDKNWPILDCKDIFNIYISSAIIFSFGKLALRATIFKIILLTS